MGIMEMLSQLDDLEQDQTPPTPEEESPTPEADTPPETMEPLLPQPPVPSDAQAYPEPEAVISDLKRRLRPRPEHIMAFLALLAAGVLLVAFLLSQPHFTQDEDPERLPQRHDPLRATEALEETFLEPTISETEPENPTIPPDRNPYGRYDFQYNRRNYLLLQNVNSSPGVDVSAYQGNIDWNKVAASGIEFAIIRLGYRGYGSGKLVQDEYAIANLEGAANAGLKVGAYFFSQALNTKEVDEEIQFMLDILGEHYLSMPIVLDWEIPTADARTANKMDARSLTDLQLHFCQVMADKGYTPMVYFNWHQSEHLYYLSELEDYPFWLALYQDRMTYPWKIEMWQWTSTGTVPGISGNVDINVYMPL